MRKLKVKKWTPKSKRGKCWGLGDGVRCPNEAQSPGFGTYVHYCSKCAKSLGPLRKCLIPGCTNTSDQGRFDGKLCGPCSDGLVRFAKITASGVNLYRNTPTPSSAAERMCFMAGMVEAMSSAVDLVSKMRTR